MEEIYDLKFVFPDPVMSLSLQDGRTLCIHQDAERTARSIAQFSEKDARTYVKAAAKFKEYMDVFIAPATYCRPHPAMEAMAKMNSHEIGRDLQALQPMSPRAIVEELFENEHVRTFFLYASCMWGLDYDLEGLGFLVPLYLNRAANYRLVVGGTHHLAHVMSKVLYKNGGMIIGPKPVSKIVIENGRAKGVETEDGYYYEAGKFIVSSLNPHQTFLELVGEKHLEPDFVVRTNDYKWEKTSFFHVHMALTEAPEFKAAENNPEVAKSFIHLFDYESYQELIDHFDAIRMGEVRDAGFNSCFPTLHDPSQAPAGKHTILLEEFAAPLRFFSEKDWLKMKREVVDHMLKDWQIYAPNMTWDNVIAHNIQTPLDVAYRHPDMKEGGWAEGAMMLSMHDRFRPVPEIANYRIPDVKNMYICSSNLHSCGGIGRGSSYNCFKKIVEDFDLPKIWEEKGREY